MFVFNKCTYDKYINNMCKILFLVNIRDIVIKFNLI